MFPSAAVLWLINVIRGSEVFSLATFIDHATSVLAFVKTLIGGPQVFGASADAGVASMTEDQVAAALETECHAAAGPGFGAAGMNPMLAALLLKAIEFALKKWLT